jgi:DNA-directed RNA polymerase specialized sigma24 family protein
MGIRVTWAGTLAGRLSRPVRASPAPDATADDVDEVLASLYRDHYRPLVRLAALLVHDVATAEHITQAAFAGARLRYRGLRDPDVRIAYLHQAVVSGARSARRRVSAPSGEDPGLDRLAVPAMLRSLPERQREALALRYYANLSETKAAAAMGVTRGALRRHTARGLTTARENAADPVSGARSRR